MRLIGLLSFFQEDPELLEATISAVADVGVDYLIAADGPYDLFESDVDYSSGECRAAIINSGMNAGIGSVVLLSKDWAGNEVEKRNYMLDYALHNVAVSGDWFLVFDSDHHWLPSEHDLKRQLASTTCDFAEVSFADAKSADGEPSWYEATLLMRVVPGMRYDGAHWRVELPDGRMNSTLRAGRGPMQAPVLDLRDQFRVWHGIYDRDAERLERQRAYYEKRDSGDIER